MSYAGSRSEILSVDGAQITRNINKTADATLKRAVTLPAANAIAGSDFVNNGDGTASATLDADHTLESGTADLYWAAGIRYGCTVVVGGTGGDEVTLSGGSGDALPITSTACTIANQVQINCPFDGDEAELVGVNSTKRSHADFQDAEGDTVREVELQAATPDNYDSDEAANPWTGDPVAVCYASNGDSTAVATLTILVLEDSTPG